MAVLEPRKPPEDFSEFAKMYGDETLCLRLLRKYRGQCANVRRWSSEQIEEILEAGVVACSRTAGYVSSALTRCAFLAPAFD